MLKQFKTKFSDIVKKESIRIDYKFLNYIQNSNFNFKTIYFKEFILKISNWKDISKDDYIWIEETNIIYPTVNNIKSNWLILDEVLWIDEWFNWWYFIENNDIVITRSWTVWITKCWNILEINDLLNREVFSIPSWYLIVVKINQNKVNPLFVELLFNSSIYKNYFNVFWVWKTQKNIAQWDIKYLPYPNLPLSTQNEIVSKIEPIEQKIKELKSQIKEQKDVINLVFARDFWFDENLANEFWKWMTALTQSLQDRKLKVNTIKLDDLTRSEIVRVSTRFHNEPTKKLMEFLDSLKTIQIKDIISENVHRWASPSYDENWEIPVIKTWHLKNWYIEISQEEFVNANFYNKNTRSQVRFWDILIASTWKWSLWKIDIVENDEIDLICDSHVSIIRVNEKLYNSLFLTYFLRSILGIFQVERDYTWATNQIELYASEIENFQIPDISLLEQQKIVDEIKLELDKQELIKKDIEKERTKIDILIEDSIKSR